MQVDILLEGQNALVLYCPEIVRVIEIAFHPAGGLVSINYRALCQILPGAMLSPPHHVLVQLQMYTRLQALQHNA